METNKAAIQKLHVRNIFQLFVPISSTVKYDVALTTTPSFGFTLTQQNAPEFCYHYQIQLFANDKNMKNEIVETEAVGCFSWAKRNPFNIQSNSENAGITLRMKIDHGTFDFRKIKKRPIKIYVTCFSAGVYLQRGSSKICKLFPKKRHADYSTVDTEVLIPVSWTNNNVSLIYPTKTESANDTPVIYRRISEDNSSPELGDDNDADSNSMQIMNSYDVDMSPNYEHENSNHYPVVYNSPLQTQMRDFENEPYMLLFNGNAEVVGNFRALNFYKASDINIKEDIRLLVEDQDPREALLKIDGVEYKFKSGIGHTTNKRFVGYIAQQIESIVPEAVQLIDGILHVDYESLIPYLSESVKQNYTDIKNVKSETERIQKIVDLLYAEFLKKNSKTDGSKGKGSTSSEFKRPRDRKKRTVLYLVMAVALAIGAAIGVFLAIVWATSGKQPDEPSAIVPIYHFGDLDPNGDDPKTRAALIEFYMATGGSNWTVNLKWLTNTSYCSWQGIYCESGRTVSSLRFESNNLVGTLPDSIANLKDLVFFEIRNNSKLTGTLPAEISAWTKLKTFDVSYNQLTGQIPRMSSEELTNLVVSYNRFNGTIPIIKSSTLNRVWFDHNELVGTIFNLRELTVSNIRINNNFLTGDLLFSKNLMLIVVEFDVSHNMFDSATQLSKLPPPQTAISFHKCNVAANAWECPIPSWMKYCNGNCTI